MVSVAPINKQYSPWMKGLIKPTVNIPLHIRGEIYHDVAAENEVVSLTIRIL